MVDLDAGRQGSRLVAYESGLKAFLILNKATNVM